MSGNGSHQHPARSVEFLSRLHDGDLDAAERARFEAHRSHCAECRRAAVEFEDAISLFRSSHSTPPRADLAARILRKVQSTNRPRAPFSPRFRLDLAAAALLATALLALLVSTPAVRRVPPPEAPEPEPAAGRSAEIGSTARDAFEPAPVPDSQAVPRSRANASRRQATPRPPLARQENEKKEMAQKSKTSEKSELRDQLAKTAEQPVDKAAEPDARRDESSSAVVAAQSPSLAAGGFEEPPASVARAAPLRLRIHSIDGYGAAPPLLPEGPVELSPQERGREYVLLLDSQGVVREVRPSPAPAALSRLHFHPGSRPRRVVVRIE